MAAEVDPGLPAAQQNAVILTTFNEADMSAVLALRSKYKEAFQKKHGLGLGFMSASCSFPAYHVEEQLAEAGQPSGDGNEPPAGICVDGKQSSKETAVDCELPIKSVVCVAVGLVDFNRRSLFH